MDHIADHIHCPLCGHLRVDNYHADRKRHYLHCQSCCLVFVPEMCWLSAEEEKAEYDKHRNDPLDKGYRQFLERLRLPMLERLEEGRQGLDFGCGPGPALSLMFEESGHRMDLFDPIYHDNTAVFSKSYDFICATEVVEHLRRPGDVFTTLFGMLRKGGWLGLMTKMVQNQAAFSQWHYIRDLTHICFYSLETFEYLADRFDAEMHIADKDVILFNT